MRHDEPTPTPAGGQTWAAPERNKGPILDVLREVLPRSGTVLEIASGSGQHALHFARELPGITWQPSDCDADNLRSIAAWQSECGLPNLLAPVELDVTREPWPVTHAAALYCANMIHIAPWPAAVALFTGAARLLAAEAPFVLYGPFSFDGVHTAESNRAFDASLRERDPRFGVRDVNELLALAAPLGLALTARVAMPAQNYTLVWRKR